MEVVSSWRARSATPPSARAAGHVGTEIAATHVRDTLLDASGLDTSAGSPVCASGLRSRRAVP